MTSETYWVQAGQLPDIDPDQIASQNYTLPLTVHQQVRIRQVSFLEKLFQEIVGRPRVLDLGCGPGVWALKLADQVESWLGYDISPEFIAHATQKATESGFDHLQFKVGSMLHVSPGQTFNLVVLGGILGYVEDDQILPLMKQVRSHLEPGGLAYVRVSVIPGIYPRITLKRGYPIHYRKTRYYLDQFALAGFQARVERDLAFTEASLATVYTAMARWAGRTGMTAYGIARRLRPLSFGLARRLLDLTPVPQSMQFILRKLD